MHWSVVYRELTNQRSETFPLLGIFRHVDQFFFVSFVLSKVTFSSPSILCIPNKGCSSLSGIIMLLGDVGSKFLHKPLVHLIHATKDKRKALTIGVHIHRD